MHSDRKSSCTRGDRGRASEICHRPCRLNKPSQDTTRKVYTFVPTQSWDRMWTDEELYAKYTRPFYFK